MGPSPYSDDTRPSARFSSEPLRLIDCDVHHTWRSVGDLFPHLSRYWVSFIEETGLSAIAGPPYPRAGGRIKAAGPPPGSSPDRVRADLVDRHGLSLAILTGGLPGLAFTPNIDLAVALSRAINDWMVETWLCADPRFRGSLTVPLQDPQAAAAEIDRLGGDARIVQVVVPAGSVQPYGRRFYHPVWEACERHGLAVGVQFGGTGIAGGTAPTAAGWPSYYIEWHAGMSQVFQAQVVSLVCEGVFERFPGLKVAFVEAGFTWVPHLMWLLDKSWRELRFEVPWLQRLPSEYIRDHVWVTGEPAENPDDEERLLQIIDMVGARRMLVFASDYPFGKIHSPEQAIPRFPPDLRRRIKVENARELYGL